jgi:MFS family permease
VRLLWCGALAFFLSFYLLLSVLPLYAADVGVPDRLIGTIIGSFAFASMLVKPAAGWASDRFGRRPVMAVGALLFIVAPLGYTVSGTVVTLLGVRLLHGLGMGLYPTAASAIVADMAPAARRGQVLGVYGIANSIALALGPLSGAAIVPHVGFRGLFAVSAIVALAAVVIVARTPETVKRDVTLPFRFAAALSRAAVFPSAIVLLLMLTYGLQVAFLPLYASRHGLNPGTFFLVFALVVALARHPAGRASDRLGRAPVAAAGLVGTAAALAVLAARPDLPGLVVAGALYGIGFGAAQPSLMAWCVDRVPATERGRAMGTYYTALELGIAAGAMSSGLAVDRFGFPPTFLGGAAAALAGAALAGRGTWGPRRARAAEADPR